MITGELKSQIDRIWDAFRCCCFGALPVRAATALGKIGTPEAREALRQVMTTGGHCNSKLDGRYGGQDVVWAARLALYAPPEKIDE